jgi:hypothetical protein
MSARASSLRRVMSTRPAATGLEGERDTGHRWDRASSGRVAFAHFALSGMALLVVVATLGAFMRR